MSTPRPVLDEEKTTTELTIAPDGRVFAFGTSRSILEVLAALQPADKRVQRLLQHAQRLESKQQRSAP